MAVSHRRVRCERCQGVRGKALRVAVLVSSLFGTLIFTAPLIWPAGANAQVLSVLPKSPPKAQSIDIVARPIKNFGGLGRRGPKFGALEFVGGLELSSSEPMFGGFSGLAFVNPQSFIAIGDKGTFFSARLLIEGGKPIGVDDAVFRFLPGIDGGEVGWRRDAEGLDIDGDQMLVSFEGDTRVMWYKLEGARVRKIVGEVRLNKQIYRANKGNKGLETVAIAPKSGPHAGSVVVMTEGIRKGMVQGWIVKGRQVREFFFPQSADMLVTDAAFTADGDLLVLERSFSLLGGLSVQIRRIKAAHFKAGRISDIDLLFRGNLAFELDNMEGMAIQSLPDGSSLISLISDDNFNSFQRTLFLQFRLPAGS